MKSSANLPLQLQCNYEDALSNPSLLIFYEAQVNGLILISINRIEVDFKMYWSHSKGQCLTKIEIDSLFQKPKQTHDQS